MQNTISERTTRRTLKQMGYSSRRPHRVPLPSAKNRKRRLRFAQAHQNWTTEDWKNVAWSDESRFLLRHSDGRVRICRKEHESMDPSCLVSMVQAAGGGVMVWGISAATAWRYRVNMDQNLWEMFITRCWIYATKNYGSSEGKRGSNPRLTMCT